MHQKARADAAQAFADVLHVAPTANELRFLLAEGLYDSTFGAGWHDDGVGSYNMGAIHSYAGWTGETFSYTDSHPDGTRYVQTFKKYPSAIDGWRDLVHEFYVRRPSIRSAARSGSTIAVATAMVRTKYAEGFGATEADRIAGWANALQNCLDEIDSQEASDSSTIPVRVVNPQGAQIGTASVSDAVAPGVTALASVYGAPVMVAYPNGWRFLQFVPGVQIPAKSNLPYARIVEAKPPTFGWEQGAFVLAIAGLAATIFFGTLSIQPGRSMHARAA
jgi:hypothetical protein